jgi:hydroxymethylbilane synthase
MSSNFLDRPLRLGTRASPLAMRQAEMTRDALLAAHGWAPDRVELVPMVATGDRIQDRALAEIGGKELWTRELDRALLNGEVDAAVHSMKDVETIRPETIAIAAMLPRADVRDRLIGASSISALPAGARVGTSSPRRTAQLLRLRPDLEILLLRGNVGTRLAKIERGEADATLLAAAGLHRLGMDDVGTAIALDEMLPAPSQGAIGIETRADDAAARDALAAISDQPTFAALALERALLAQLGADCRSPLAAFAEPDGTGFRLRAEIYASDGSDHVASEDHIGSEQEARNMARDMLTRAGASVRSLFAC